MSNSIVFENIAGNVTNNKDKYYYINIKPEAVEVLYDYLLDNINAGEKIEELKDDLISDMEQILREKDYKHMIASTAMLDAMTVYEEGKNIISHEPTQYRAEYNIIENRMNLQHYKCE